MKLLDILGNVKYSIINGEDKEIRDITIDSRKVNQDSLFVCIDGFHADGHKFIFDAYERGASAFLIEKDIADYPKDATVIKVKNSRLALSFMAGNFYENPANKFNLIGITGTNGKTSSTYFLNAVLKEHGHRTGIIGTVETLVDNEPAKTQFATSTTPDSIELQQIFTEMADKKVDDVVMEVTSHALQLNKVCGLNFKVSVFTNLTQDHLDLHGSMEEYKKVKGKLFEMSESSVVNIDDKYGEYMISACSGEFITYSIDKPSNLQAKNIEYYNNKVEFDLSIGVEKHHFVIPIPGKFTIYNALGVIGAAIFMKIPVETIQNAFLTLKGVPGRIQPVPNNRGIGVYIDYSHTPDGLENIISAVRNFTENKVITVFGCGGDRDRTKRPIMGNIAAKNSDFCVATSDNPRSENPEKILADIEPGMKETSTPYVKIVDRKEAIQYAITMANPGDSVIIAGKGHENYQIFADKTIHFDDYEVASEVLSGL